MFDFISGVLKSNPLLAGGAGMAVMGWIMVQARSLPLKLWRTIQDQFSVTLTVYSEDSAFRFLQVWLAKHQSARRTRRFNVAVYHNPRKDDDDYVLTPGAGLHILRQGMRFFLVNRTMEQSSPGNDFYNTRRQTISITTLGRSQEPVKQLLSEVLCVKEDHDTIPVYVWAGNCYSLVERRLKRPMETVYADPALKAALIADVQRFQGRRPWYNKLSIPWRRGYMLEGPPGTGKSTLIFAIASLLEKPLYLINPATLDNDNALQRAMNEAGAGVVALEDIDSLRAAADREEKKAIRQAVVSGAASAGASGLVEPTATGDASKSGVTNSGLLNAIDGIGARDGRILFITTNHSDTLDAALLRPGRIDKRYYLDHGALTQAEEMYRQFFPGLDPSAFLEAVGPLLPLSAADLQNRLLELAEVC